MYSCPILNAIGVWCNVVFSPSLYLYSFWGPIRRNICWGNCLLLAQLQSIHGSVENTVSVAKRIRWGRFWLVKSVKSTKRFKFDFCLNMFQLLVKIVPFMVVAPEPKPTSGHVKVPFHCASSRVKVSRPRLSMARCSSKPSGVWTTALTEMGFTIVDYGCN